MKTASLICSLLLLISLAFGESVKSLPEVMKPQKVSASGKYLYVAEKSYVHIYNLKDLKYLKKIGGKGQGPGEFPLGINLCVDQEYLYVFCMGKMGIFSLDGQYVKEFKTSHIFFNLFPIKSGFVGYGGVIDPEKGFVMGVSLYDRELNKKHPIFFNKKKPRSNRQVDLSTMKAVHGVQRFGVIENKVIKGDSREGFNLKVLDLKGQIIREINKNYDKKIISSDFKRSYTKQNEIQRGGPLAGSKVKFTFPEFFPPFENLLTDKKWIYLISYLEDKKNRSIKKMDVKGNMTDFGKVIGADNNLYTIKNGTYYGLVENIAEERWVLHTIPINRGEHK